MDFKEVGKWLYLIGVLVAIIAAILSEAGVLDLTWLPWVLMIVGVLVGIFYVDLDDLKGIIIRYFGLYLAHDAFDGFPGIGEYLTAIFGAFFIFMGPIVMTALLMWFIKKCFMKTNYIRIFF